MTSEPANSNLFILAMSMSFKCKLVSGWQHELNENKKLVFVPNYLSFIRIKEEKKTKKKSKYYDRTILLQSLCLAEQLCDE